MKFTIACSSIYLILTATAFPAPNGYFDLQAGAKLETGDSWLVNGSRYRLFGVQSFPRGTTFKNKIGEDRDGGDASLAVLAAYIADTKPVCAEVIKAADATYVTCYINVGGNYLDLGMVLISSGYAYAALANGAPYYAPYALAESRAQEHHNGLWQFISKPTSADNKP